MPKPESHFIVDTKDTYLGRTLADDVADRQPGESGFVPVSDGIDALAMWRTFESGETVIYNKEPLTSWGQRFMAGLMRFLPIRGQL
jgi:hypothetical protein